MDLTTADGEIDVILEETKNTARIIFMPMPNACVGAELAILRRAKALDMLNGTLEQN